MDTIQNRGLGSEKRLFFKSVNLIYMFIPIISLDVKIHFQKDQSNAEIENIHSQHRRTKNDYKKEKRKKKNKK